MKMQNVLMLAIGIAVLPAAAIVVNQNRAIETVAEETVEQPATPTAAAPEDENTAVQNSMKEYVQALIADDDLMPVLHEGKILKLKLAKSEKYPDGFHAGVSNQGDLFTSCADFVDPKTGDKYDIDFLVSKVDGDYKVVQPFVHSVNGEKNPYDLAH